MYNYSKLATGFCIIFTTILCVLMFFTLYSDVGSKNDNFYYLTSVLGQPKYAIKELTIENTASTIMSVYEGNGKYRIYLSAGTFDQFYGQLNHEICHLRNIDVYDVYMEGLCSYYSKIMYDKMLLNHEGWENYYKIAYNDDVYGASYLLMKTLHNWGFNVFTIPNYAVKTPSSNYPNEHKIDINAWIKSQKRQDIICEVLQNMWHDLESVKNKNLNSLSLDKPSCVK